MHYLLEVEGVRKAFPGVLALDDVSMQVRAGTVHALMGENGAGKSTLMKIVAGLLTPDAGRVVLQGRVAMIHQELHLMPSMTVAENIFLGREPLTRFGFIDDRALCAADVRAARRARHRHRSRATRRRPDHCPAADGRDCARRLVRSACPHHGRADVGALGARSGAAVRDRRPISRRAGARSSTSRTRSTKSSESRTR